MIRFIYFGITLYLLSFGCTSSELSDSLETKLDEYLSGYLEIKHFSGSVLVAKEGKILLSKGYGKANVEHDVANAPQTVFHLASVSRIFTSTAILLMVQEGKLRLDDTIDHYLPDYPKGDVITVKHLLTLSAGFPNINSMEEYDQWSLYPQTPETLVSYFKNQPLKFEPGTNTEHSNSNYNVLALLIEKISGLNYGDFLKEKIFSPLAMLSSGHDGDPATIIANEASGYAPFGVAELKKADYLNWSVKTGNGSLYSSVEDLYKFDRAVVANKFLSRELLVEAFTEHFPNKGYGWFIRPRFEDREIYINGRSPGFGCYFGRLEKKDLTVIILGNLYNSLSTDIARAIMGIVLGQNVKPPRYNTEPPDQQVVELLMGEYQFGEDFYVPGKQYKITNQEGHLLADGDWLIPNRDFSFIHSIYTSEIKFVKDKEGRIVYATWDGFKGVKIE